MPNSRASEGRDQLVEQEVAEAQQREAKEGGSAPDQRERELVAELGAMEDRYKRALADLDNYRKRSARETERRIAESREAQLREWLEAVDSVERALMMDLESPLMVEQGSAIRAGLRSVLDQMEAILGRQGIQRIGAVGERFDPERHEAVGVRFTDEAPDRTVVDVARSGFALGDRVLRPAEVIVSREEPRPDG
jgi:molecular chaperone GrpE